MRVIHGVHRDASVDRAPPEPALAARFPYGDVLVLDVADLTDRRPALHVDLPDLAGGQLYLRVDPLLGEHLRRGTRAPRKLRAAPHLQLDVVHHRAQRDVLERQDIADLDIRIGARDHGVTHLEPERGHDVSLLAVFIVQAGDAGRTIRVVLDGDDLRRDVDLVPAKIDDPLHPLVPATTVPERDVALVVPAAAPPFRLEKTLERLGFRDLVERRHRHEPPAWRCWRELSDTHLGPLEVLDHLLAFGQRHVCFLPVRSLADVAPSSHPFAVCAHRAHLGHLHLEELLDGLLDFYLPRLLGDLETENPALVLQPG